MSLLQKTPLFSLLVFLALASCARKPQAILKSTAITAIPVQTATAESRRIDRSISVSGSLLADESVAVSSESAGRIEGIYVDFGQPVRKGQVVAKLDDAPYCFQLERAEAALRQAQARLGLDPKGYSQSTLASSSRIGLSTDSTSAVNATDQTPAMREAQAQMEDARFKFRNAQKLVKSGDISEEHFNELEKAFRAREAAYEDTRNAMLTEFANFDALKADIDLARKHVADCTLRAPFDGSVADRPVSPGQYAKENTTVLTIVKASPLRLRANLPESAAATVKPGSTLTFTTAAIPGHEFHAVVRELNPSLDAHSRTLAVEARIDNQTSNNSADERLRPGMFVQVQLVTKPNIEVTVVPPSALYSLAGLSKVFLIQDGQAREVPLASPNSVGNWIEVPSDRVHPGDTVAVSNLPMLIDGAKVQVTRS